MRDARPIQWVYISHPYSGDEDANLQRAELLRRELQAKNPRCLFINPLAMLGGKECSQGYCQALAYAMEILSRCQAVVFADGWEKSAGCRAEMAFAIQQNIMVKHLDDYRKPGSMWAYTWEGQETP